LSFGLSVAPHFVQYCIGNPRWVGIVGLGLKVCCVRVWLSVYMGGEYALVYSWFILGLLMEKE
jgi:hypothetical protein